MKGGLAAAMVAAAAFRRAGVEPRGKLVVGALVDEEDRMLGVAAPGHHRGGARAGRRHHL